MDRPAPAAAAAVRVAALDAQRSARYAALLQLIEEIQCRRGLDEVVEAAASHWKQCVDVRAWRLLCVHRDRAALIEACGAQADISRLALTALPAWDAQQWVHGEPRYVGGAALAALRSELPRHLVDFAAAELAVLPVQQGGSTIALLSATSSAAAFDPLDRKFLEHVAGAMAGRIVALMTEQALADDLAQAEQRLAQQIQAASVGRLVNGVAHELNTPLGVQISACDALRTRLAQRLGSTGAADEAGDAELLSTVELVGRQALRAANIVRRLKQISVVSAPGGRRVRTPLLATLETIAEACAERSEGVEIVLAGEEEVALDLDREALGALLGELIDNASVHARRADGRPCELVLELQTAGGGTTLDIRDNGPGIAEAAAERFFQPFATTRQAFGHMGLGSYIARSLARDALHGELRLMRSDAEGLWLQLDFCDLGF